MEKKKLLLVAVSVGVVLLIVIGIPLMLLPSGRDAAPTWQVASQIHDGTDRFARVEPPGQQAPGEIAVREPAPEQIVTVPVPPPVPAPAPVVREEAPQVVTTITIQPPRTAPAVPAPTPPPAARPAQPVPTPPPPAQPPREAERPVQIVRTPAAPAQATRNNFWIQAGAFSSKARAETVKESLEAKGIASIIENRNINGRTYYRVRIGPYLSANEANYWLALVSSIDGFGSSWVSQVPAPAN